MSSLTEDLTVTAQMHGWRSRALEAERKLRELQAGTPVYRVSGWSFGECKLEADRPDVHPEKLRGDISALRFSHPRFIGGGS